MRTPKYTLKEFKEVKKRTPKQVEDYKLKIKNYKGFQKVKTKEKSTLNNLYQRTKSKIKGKKRNQIKKIWTNYTLRKRKIQSDYVEKRSIFAPKGISFSKTISKVFTNEKSYYLNTSNPDLEIYKFILDKLSKPELEIRYFLLVLIGKNDLTGEKIILSDTFSFVELENRNEKDGIRYLFSEMMDTLSTRPTKSGDDFTLKKIMLRLTFDK